MDKEMKDKECRKRRWIIVGDSRLCGLSKENAFIIADALRNEGRIINCMTEYRYQDECGYRGRVSTDITDWGKRGRH